MTTGTPGHDPDPLVLTRVPPAPFGPSRRRLAFAGVDPWDKPTLDQVRHALLAGAVRDNRGAPAASDPLPPPSRRMSDDVGPSALLAAVQAGRLFDMGHLPNSVLQSESRRAGALARAGHIHHPFRESYCLWHTWDGGGGVGFYLVLPIANESSSVPNDPVGMAITDIIPLYLNGRPTLMLGDSCVLLRDGKDPTFFGIHLA